MQERTENIFLYTYNNIHDYNVSLSCIVVRRVVLPVPYGIFLLHYIM